MEEKLEEKYKEIQKKLSIIDCYKEILRTKNFLSKTKKKQFEKLEAYSVVERELEEFCDYKIKSITTGSEEKDSKSDFTVEEVLVLKQVAQKLMKAPTQTKEKVTVEPVQSKSNIKTKIKPEVIKNVQKRLTIIRSEDDTIGKDPSEFIGCSTRTLTHDSLKVNEQFKNSIPPSYASVKILNIRGKRAEIEFLSDGVRGEIDIRDLNGFEYLD